MGIGMEIAKFQQLAQPRHHPGADQGRRIQVVGFQLAAALELDAMDPLGGEHPPATQGTLHPRHCYLRMVGKELGKILGIIGFLEVVDFGEQTATKFIDNVS